VDALQWGNANKSNNKDDKIFLIGHSMGSGVSVVLCTAFPKWFSSLVLLESGLITRDAQDAPKHVRATCQRKMKSNTSLFGHEGACAHVASASASAADNGGIVFLS